MNTEKATIYIPLLGEGVPVWRPTIGELVQQDVYKVLPTENYDPASEQWMFVPGSLVKCSITLREGKQMLIATKQYEDQGSKARPMLDGSE